MKVGDIFVALGFKVDDSGLKSFDQSIDNLTKKVALNAAAMTGALYAVDRLAMGAVDRARDMYNFATETDQSTIALQKWQANNRLVGVSNEETQGSILALNNALVTLRRTGQGSGPFGFLGILDKIDPNDPENPMKVLELLRNAMKTTKLTASEFSYYLKQIGVDPRFITALKQTNQEFEKLSENKILSEEQQRSLVNLGAIIDDLKTKGELSFAEFIERNKDGFVAGVDLITTFANDVSDAYSELKLLAGEIPDFEEKATVAGIAIAAAWKPWLTTITLLVEGLASIKKFREGENTPENMKAREAAGQPRFQGGLIADFYNYMDKAFSESPEDKEAFRQKYLSEPIKIIVDGKPYGTIGANGEVNINNTFQIQTTEDGESFGRSLAPTLADEYQKAVIQTNNGPVY